MNYLLTRLFWRARRWYRHQSQPLLRMGGPHGETVEQFVGGKWVAEGWCIDGRTIRFIHLHARRPDPGEDD